MAIPTTDPALAAWSTNANTRIVASPTTFSLTTAQATAYTAVHDPWIAAYEAASAIGSRSRALVAAKNTAKANLLRYAREIYAIVQASQAVSDENKELLGVHVKKTEPTPVPPPDAAPMVDVVQVLGNTVTVHLHDAETSLRRKPAGVLGANVFSFVGENPPTEASGWEFQGATSKTTVDVPFAASVPPGAQVWIIASWFNRKAVTGPACQPVGARLQFAAPQPMAA